MKLHRFYVGEDLELDRKVWINDQRLLHQWTKVLRFQRGTQLTLFNSLKEERLYEVDVIEPKAIHLRLVTELKPKTPAKEVYLAFSLMKKDKNAFVLQKCTEIGVRHFVPLLADRTEKTGFDIDRYKRVMVEAAEQCGRADIPSLRDPVSIEKMLNELENKCQIVVAEQGGKLIQSNTDQPVVVLIGPEGGWSDAEKELFTSRGLQYLGLGEFTLRAETACIVAASKLC